MIKNKVFHFMLDMIYPRRCTFCDCILGVKEQYVCKACRNKVPSPVKEPKCKKCGKPLTNDIQEYCHDCSMDRHSFEYGKGVFLYRDLMKDAVMRFKFHGRKEYGFFLGKLMCLYSKGFIEQINPEVLIPVPIHRKKRNVRGFNQAEVLAKMISKGFSIPLRTDLVLRKKFTKAQKELNRKERKKNLQKAFEVKEEAGAYNCVLLIDDIYTTGSTIDGIAEKLKEQGVKKVYFLALCIGQGM